MVEQNSRVRYDFGVRPYVKTAGRPLILQPKVDKPRPKVPLTEAPTRAATRRKALALGQARPEDGNRDGDETRGHAGRVGAVAHRVKVMGSERILCRARACSGVPGARRHPAGPGGTWAGPPPRSWLRVHGAGQRCWT